MVGVWLEASLVPNIGDSKQDQWFFDASLLSPKPSKFLGKKQEKKSSVGGLLQFFRTLGQNYQMGSFLLLFANELIPVYSILFWFYSKDSPSNDKSISLFILFYLTEQLKGTYGNSVLEFCTTYRTI